MLNVMYQWLLFLHIAAVLGFMLAHGVHVSVIWKQRSESDPQRNLALFDALPNGMTLRIMAGVVVLTGFLLVFSLDLWGRWWVWLSLLLLGAVWVLMFWLGGAYYNLIEQAATQAIAARGSANESAAVAEYHRARLAWHPIAMTAVGFVGLGAIVWLMIFKPL
jgi:hypothetical protein